MDPNNAAYERALKVERLRAKHWKAMFEWNVASGRIREHRTKEDDWARMGKHDQWRERLCEDEAVCAGHRAVASYAGLALVEMDEEP